MQRRRLSRKPGIRVVSPRLGLAAKYARHIDSGLESRVYAGSTVNGRDEMSTMTIGRLAKQVGVNIDTIRYYERNGLIPEPLSFYFNLLRYPLTKSDAGAIALLHSALLAIGQVANAAGVLVERYRSAPRGSAAQPAMERPCGS